MATYIQGSTDFIPQVQPYQPDFTTMQNTLSAKQTKYEYAKKQLSNVYGSLLNSPMTREDNIANRDQFFKDIDVDIKKMAGMDLSKVQNVESATQIFSQLLDDKAIVHDMTWTKNFQNQVQASQFLKLDGKRDNGDMWWDGGDRLLQYAQEEYKNASPEEAMQMGNVEYVAGKDIYGMALKMAKDNKMEVKQDVSNGTYIYKYTNGKAAYEPFQKIFMGAIGQDPGVQRWYAAKAQLEMKDYAHSNLQQYGSLQAAEQAYCDQMGQAMEQQYGHLMNVADDDSRRNNYYAQRASNNIDSVAYSDEEKGQMEQLIDAYATQGEQTEQTAALIKDGRQIPVQGKYSPGAIAAMSANLALYRDLGQVSMAVADMHSSVSVSADPYGMAKFKHNLEMEKMNMKYQYDVMLANLKGEIKNAGKSNGSSGGAGNGEITYSDYDGAIVGDTAEESQFGAYNMRGNAIQEAIQDVSGYELAFSDAYLQALSSETNDGDFKDIAMQEYVNMVSAGMNTNQVIDFGGDENENFKQYQADFKKAMSGELTMAEKYEICKSYQSKMKETPEALSAMSEYAMKNFDGNSPSNKLLASQGFRSLWSSEPMVEMRNGIRQRESYITTWRESMVKDRDNLLNGIYADQNYGSKTERENLRDIISAYYKEDGTFATKDEYTKRLLSSGLAERMGANEEEIKQLAEYTYNNYDEDRISPIRSGRERLTDKYVNSDAWEVNKGHWWDTDMIFGVKDAFKTLYGQHSTINADLEGQGMGWNRALGFMVSGNPDNGNSSFNGDVQQFIMQAQNTLGGYAEVYQGGLSANPESKDAISDKDAQMMLAEILQDTRSKDSAHMFQMRYVNVARGKADQCALEITLPGSFTKNLGDKITESGGYTPNKITIYMDKSQYNGGLSQLGKSNMLDEIMKINGSVPIDTASDITKGLAIRKGMDGRYLISGSVYDGLRYTPFNSMTMGRTYDSPAAAYQDWNQIMPYLYSMLMQAKQS